MEFTLLLSVPMFLILVPVLVFLYIKRAQSYWKRRGVSQMEPNIFWGDLKSITTEMDSQGEFYAQTYFKGKSRGEKGIGLYAGWAPLYVPTNEELVKRIMVKDFSSFDGTGMYHHETDALSMNVFAVAGDQWKKQRTKMTPMFTAGKLKQMYEVIKGKGENMRRIVQEHVDMGQLIDVKDVAARYTTDIIGEVAFGLDSNTLRDAQHQFREIGRSFIKPSPWKRTLELVFPSGILSKFGYRSFPSDIYDYFVPLIKSAMDNREKTGFQKVDFLQLLIQLRTSLRSSGAKPKNDQKNSLFTETEMLGNAFAIYAAGYETSANTICFATYELASNPEIQEKLRKEIWDSFEKNNNQITYESISEMEYLDKVLKETFRKYPVVCALGRACTKDYAVDDTVTLESGTQVIIPVTGLHWDPEFYPNPEQFNPENFTPENVASRPDGAYLPFGGGPRLCLGMRLGILQTKLALITLIKEFRFALDESTKGKPMEYARGVFLTASKNPILMKATKI